MASYTNYFVYCTDSMHSSAPDLTRLDWKDVMEFFAKFRTFITDESSYHNLSNEEFGESVAEMSSSLLCIRKDEEEVARYFGHLGAPKEDLKHWCFGGSAFYLESFSGYSTYIKVNTGLGETNAFKLLTELMNKAAEDMGETFTKYFFEARTETYAFLSDTATTISANNVVAGTLTAAPANKISANVPVVKTQAATSDFL